MFNLNSSPLLIHDTFIKNTVVLYGSGMYNLDNSNPILTHCIFRCNSAVAGGGISSAYSAPKVTNCTFIGNSVDDSGGGMCTGSSSPTVTNCIFSANKAYKGGAMHNFWSCDINVTSCTFSGNQADYGNTMAFERWQQTGGPSNTEIINSILWDGENEMWNDDGSTIIITYSDVQGGWFGAGDNNIDTDPCFVDADNPDPNLWNLRLKPNSSCIDKGSNAAVPSGTTEDLDGYPRIIDGDCNGVATVDMGAYEFNYAYMGDLDYNCSVDFFDFSIFGRAWETEEGDADYDPACDISEPPDDYIDWRDLAIMCDNWLARIP
jgi:parallel beta-helix repeat protein